MPIAQKISGRTMQFVLEAALGNPMSTATYEGFCGGNTRTLLPRAPVCYAPTEEILRRAVAENKNLIISREHHFLHGGLHFSYASGGLDVALKDHLALHAKREVITANNLMIYRFGAA